MPDQPTIINPELERRAQGEDADKLLDVIVELRQDPDQEQSATHLRESFSRAKEPVSDAISRLGGAITGEAWINHTLRARVPAYSLESLSDLDSVRALDVPHEITPD
jgi:hypothetical protein